MTLNAYFKVMKKPRSLSEKCSSDSVWDLSITKHAKKRQQQLKTLWNLEEI